MNNKTIWLLLIIIILIGTAFLYYFSNEEIRAI